MKNKLYKLMTIFLLSISLFSCKKTNPRYDSFSLDNCASWCIASEDETIEDAQNHTFQPLKLEYSNLRSLLGDEKSFAWVKFDFFIPESLKDKELGVVFPYINFAEKAWCNGHFIGESGLYPPKEYSSLYNAHFYPLTKENLNEDGINTILLKVFSQENGSVSNGTIIAEYDRACHYTNSKNFFSSKIYLMFEGILTAAFLFLLFFYFASKAKYMLYFAFSCLSTFFFLAFFSGAEWPGYADKIVPFLLFAKLTLFYGFYFSTYSVINFMFSFLGLEHPKNCKIIKNIVLFTTIIITLFVPAYTKLIRFFLPMALVYSALLIYANILIVINNKKIQNRKQIFYMSIGFLPSIICIFIDFIVRNTLHNINHPFYMIFGWEITVTFFIFFLSIEYYRLFVQNVNFNKDLQRQIELRTVDLTFANEKLLYENHIAQKDLNMASIVQQKFFTRPDSIIDNWEIALVYEPLDKVSGDLYDFYIKNDELNGFSLFDVSGHGIAAALITMLSKNIIYKAFCHCLEQKQNVSTALLEINDKIIKAKGDIENYLTGIMVRFTRLSDESSKVELSSAGHPYPVLYSSQQDKIINLKDFEKEAHFGAIGMEGIEVSFDDIEFTMNKGDILVAFSDGIIELSDENRNAFGRERLESLVKENKDLPIEEILEKLKSQAITFRGDNPRDDDLTVIILRKI